MQNLYNNLADGIKKEEALRQAKIQYMKSAKGIMAHPAFGLPSLCWEIRKLFRYLGKEGYCLSLDSQLTWDGLLLVAYFF
jgi:hypothetical protein